MNIYCSHAGACRFPSSERPGVQNAWGLVHQFYFFLSSTVIGLTGDAVGIVSCYNEVGQDFDPCSFTIPLTVAESTAYASPTGVVWNSSNQFPIASGGGAAPAVVIVATREGTLVGINSDVDGQSGVVAVDNSAAGASYTGLAIGANAQGNYLYAVDIHRRAIDVVDGQWRPATLAGGFVDPDIPPGFTPFGIQNVDGELFVTYALRSADGNGDLPGDGYVSVFDTDGQFRRRFASNAPLDAPWGITRAPAGFGDFAGALIIANHGDGRLYGFDASGALLGPLARPNHKPIVIDGLRGIAGAEATGKVPAAVYFAAGPNGGADGLFGRIEPNG
jgi:uncharacterized protein (TIGR03118 family)